VTSGDVLRLEFSPDGAEHGRAVAALTGRGRPLSDVLPLMVVFLATTALAGLMDGMAGDVSMLWAGLVRVVPLAMFLLGVGIAIRRSRGHVVWRVGADGIEIDRPRRRLRVGWAQVGGVEETAEFFLLRLRTVGYYLPKRVLTAEEAGMLRSRMADALNERATLNLNGSG
jgi:hypothetical protein